MEIWKDIKDYEGMYQVSNLGNIKALDREVYSLWNNRIVKGKMRKPTYDKDNYLLISLSKEGKTRTFKVHRLVAEAFIPNPEEKPTVNHINGKKDDNRIENLEWATDKEQMKHCREVLGWKPDESRLRRRKVKRSDGKIYNSIKEAGIENNLFPSNITMCCQGKVKTIGGYSWEYV